jgi:hypothetical protein
MVSYVSLYLMFRDLHVCRTYAMLHSTHLSVYISDVSYFSVFSVVLSKLHIVFVVLYSIFF